MSLQKLHELGRAVRTKGECFHKWHGSEWRVTLPNGVKFIHDDYNHSVMALYPNGERFYFGMDFGGYTGQNVTEEQYESAIAAILYGWEDGEKLGT